MAQSNVSVLHPEKSDLSVEFQLPADFSVVKGDEGKSPFQQNFNYTGSRAPYEAMDELLKAGWKINAKGAGRNTGNGMYRLVEHSIYSND